jgi:hypothetical protein
METAPMPRYRVMVDDDFHYQDLDERREQGTYKSVDEALTVCLEIVDQSLQEEYRPGISAEALCMVATRASALIRSSKCSTVRMIEPCSRPGATRRSAVA